MFLRVKEMCLLQCALDGKSTAGNRNDIRIIRKNLLPRKLSGGLVLSCEEVNPSGILYELRDPMTGTKRWVDPFKEQEPAAICIPCQPAHALNTVSQSAHEIVCSSFHTREGAEFQHTLKNAFE